MTKQEDILLVAIKNMNMDAYEIIEKIRKEGKIEKGTNEVTKAIERGTAKLVVYAADVEPKEIVKHIPVICKEKGVRCHEVDNKKKLGIAAGLPVGASSIVITDLGKVDISQLK